RCLAAQPRGPLIGCSAAEEFASGLWTRKIGKAITYAQVHHHGCAGLWKRHSGQIAQRSAGPGAYQCGDIFRWHIQSHTKLGARIKRIMDEGQLVPDDVVEEVVKQRLEQHDWNYGFILDGFPRNSRQAAFFLESYDIDAVLLIEVPDALVQE